MAELEAFFLDLSAKSGLPADQLKYVCCLLAAIPLGWVFHLLPRSAPSIRHLFSIIVSIAFASFCLGPYSWAHALLSSGVAYLMMVLLPHGIAHRVVFVVRISLISRPTRAFNFLMLPRCQSVDDGVHLSKVRVTEQRNRFAN
jgi:uncharacterized membrane protein